MSLRNIKGRPIDRGIGPSRVLQDMASDYVRGAFDAERMLYRAEVMQIDTVGGQIQNASNSVAGDYLNPPNSILAKIYTRNLNSFSGEEDYTLCFPLFPQHLCPPIKVGEHVYIMFEDLMTKKFAIWLTRVPEPYQLDDLNYNFTGDRDYCTSNDTKDSEYVMDQDSKIIAPSDIKTKTESRIKDSNMVQEPIPNYIREPHEMVIQGSNNTLLRMGVDSKSPESGLIDIVVGRGYGSSNSVKKVDSKHPWSRGLKISDHTSVNEEEGKIDLDTDKSRIYLSMKTNVDEKFGTDGADPKSVNESTAVVKADAIRIIARKSIKIVSESGAAMITIDDTGKIVIGTGSGQNQLFTHQEFSKYVTQLNTYLGALQAPPGTVGGPLVPPGPAPDASAAKPLDKIFTD